MKTQRQAAITLRGSFHQALSDARRTQDEAIRNYRQLLDMEALLFSGDREILITDSKFLRDLVTELTPTKDESILYVTGPSVARGKVLSRTLPLEYEKQSPVYAQATPKSCSDALIGLLEDGNELHVMAHCHPGSGAGSTHPSSIDIDYMIRVQQPGSKVIGIIVTRDGYVRFFSPLVPFRVLVLGNKIQTISEVANEPVYKVEVSK